MYKIIFLILFFTFFSLILGQNNPNSNIALKLLNQQMTNDYLQKLNQDLTNDYVQRLNQDNYNNNLQGMNPYFNPNTNLNNMNPNMNAYLNPNLNPNTYQSINPNMPNYLNPNINPNMYQSINPNMPNYLNPNMYQSINPNMPNYLNPNMYPNMNYQQGFNQDWNNYPLGFPQSILADDLYFKQLIQRLNDTNYQQQVQIYKVFLHLQRLSMMNQANNSYYDQNGLQSNLNNNNQQNLNQNSNYPPNLNTNYADDSYFKLMIQRLNDTNYQQQVQIYKIYLHLQRLSMINQANNTNWNQNGYQANYQCTTPLPIGTNNNRNNRNNRLLQNRNSNRSNRNTSNRNNNIQNNITPPPPINTDDSDTNQFKIRKLYPLPF